MKKNMFINAERGEVRIAITSDGALSELYTERASSASQVGNIYKGRVTNVEPSIQAAFVDFGNVKNGFLHISDLHPKHFPGQHKHVEAVGKKRARKTRPPIQNCLHRGDDVVVQVTKEGMGTKGATLTTYLSIPGRYLVLMPGMQRLGVSRKIEDEATRVRMRGVLAELKPPPDIGFIVRTAGVDRPKQDLQRDLNYLLRLWKTVANRAKDARSPADLYQESDLIIRTIRDVYTSEIDRLICDSEPVACKVKEFLQLIMPRSSNRVELYTGDMGLFHAFGIESELEGFNSPVVPLPAGGSLVIEQTEALVAIDVNSGRFRDSDNAEAMAVRINTEAVQEIARQLRLRDLGGVIVLDLIDMGDERNRRKVERVFRDAVKSDRARTKVLKMSSFGIVEMTRQRIRPSLLSSIFRPCPTCRGAGRIMSPESQALAGMRTLRLAANDENVTKIVLTLAPAVAEHLLNHRRNEIADLEKAHGVSVLVQSDPGVPPGEVRVACGDARGSAIPWNASDAVAKRPKTASTREIAKADVAEFRKRLRQEAGNKEGPVVLPLKAATEAQQPPESQEAEPAPPKAKKRRRRRKKSKSPQAEAGPPAKDKPEAPAKDKPEAVPEGGAPPAKKKKTRRGRRRRKKSGASSSKDAETKPAEPAPPAEGS